MAILAGCTAITGNLNVLADGLTTLDPPALASIGGDLISSNGADHARPAGAASTAATSTSGLTNLPTCAAEAIRDQLLALGFTGFVEIYGNNDAGTCP